MSKLNFSFLPSCQFYFLLCIIQISFVGVIWYFCWYGKFGWNPHELFTSTVNISWGKQNKPQMIEPRVRSRFVHSHPYHQPTFTPQPFCQSAPRSRNNNKAERQQRFPQKECGLYPNRSMVVRQLPGTAEIIIPFFVFRVIFSRFRSFLRLLLK